MTSVAAGPEIDRDLGEYFGAYPLAAIRESPLNPRTHYDPKALEELAQNLRAQGQITPGLVRFADPPEAIKIDGAVWEVVEIAAGHRRRRALGLAELETMAVIRRRMDDAEFIEVLNCENLQRDNLHPLEEAQGFRTLMERAGYEVGRLAARVGRDRSYVYDRLKLLQLVPDAQALFLAGRFELGHAVLLARLGPSDQERAIESRRSGNGRIGGLFVNEAALLSVEEEEALDVALDAPEGAQDPVARTAGLKPVSVRELKGWIDRHVRFRPEEVDLPNLFPETEQALQVATEQELKVIKITREHLVTDEAKDPSERTYGNRAWKRADGVKVEENTFHSAKGKQVPSTCEHAVMGVVVAGPGRGEAFLVCIAKQKCQVHWGAEIRAAARVAKAKAGVAARGEGPADRAAAFKREQESWEEQQAREHAERKRWEKAGPAILEALVTRLPEVSVAGVGLFVVETTEGYNAPKMPVALLGQSPEAFLRQAAYRLMDQSLSSSLWRAEKEWPRLLKWLGIDPKKIRDQVAPLPKAEKPKAVKKAKKSKAAGKPKKKRAGDVARAKAKKKGASA